MGRVHHQGQQPDTERTGEFEFRQLRGHEWMHRSAILDDVVLMEARGLP